MSDNGNNLVRLCGLWEAHGDKGDYLRGKLGAAKVFLFKNRQKASDKSPDYWLCVAPAPQETGKGATAAKAGAFVNAHGLEVSDSDVPF